MNFKYQLDPSSKKFFCPGCNQKRLVRYIDVVSSKYCEREFGRCDREVKCGYHRIPSGNQFTRDLLLPETRQPYFVSKDLFLKTLTCYGQNNLYKFLCTQFGEMKAISLVSLYKVGTSKHWSGATLFWQINSWGRIGQGKIMLFNEVTGKRVKDPFPHISSVHRQLDKQDQKPDYCFFGEHLLPLFPNKFVAIVESEKTALMMAAVEPSCLWIASGGLSQLTPKRLFPVKGRQIIFYPDLGANELWDQKALELNQTGFRIKTSTLLEERATENDRSAGFDIADFIDGTSH